MSRALTLLLALTQLAGCGGEEFLRLDRPLLLQGLGGEVDAWVEVYKEASAAGDPVETEPLEPDGDAFIASVRLKPGDYFFWLRFNFDDGGDPVRIGEYREVPHQVQAREDAVLSLGGFPFVYEEFDEDGDGIPNLDEERFGFSMRAADTDLGTVADRAVILGPGQGRAVQIGSTDPDSSVVEQPAHPRALVPYALDLHEVTEERFRVCVAQRRCEPPVTSNRDDFLAASGASRRPATGVTRADARIFCEQLAGGRLPNEYEWEFAARAHDTLYPWGDLLDRGEDRCDYVNARYYVGATAAFPCETSASGAPDLMTIDALYPEGCAALPGSSPGAQDGPCELAGNAWEWTDSELIPYPNASWEPPAGGPLAVVRGGSADSLDFSLRATFRVGITPSLEGHATLAPYVGFRCAYDQ